MFSGTIFFIKDSELFSIDKDNNIKIKIDIIMKKVSRNLKDFNNFIYNNRLYTIKLL